MKVADVAALLEAWAPLAHAEPWDNVGLLVGDPADVVGKIALVVDVTEAALDEILAAQCEMIVAYHPPIFAPLKRIAPGTPLARALRAGLSIYSPHTALDVAAEGTNDVLADVIGMGARTAIRPLAPKDADYKLVTFVPEEAVAQVSEAIFRAGAGRIGRYTSCSFRTKGTGTFFGEEGTRPVVGAAQRFEEVSELRLETVVPVARAAEVVRALRESHPYEEPAFDLVRLAAAAPRGPLGLGRVGDLAKPTSRADLLATIRRGLGVEHLLVAGPTEGGVTRVAVAAGACGDLVHEAKRAGAELYLTGEMRHHEAREVLDRGGLTVVAALHSNSERVALRRLGARLQEALPGLDVVFPASDVDPFRVV